MTRKFCECNIFDVVQIRSLNENAIEVVVINPTLGRLLHNNGQIGFLDPNKIVTVVGRMKFSVDNVILP